MVNKKETGLQEFGNPQPTHMEKILNFKNCQESMLCENVKGVAEQPFANTSERSKVLNSTKDSLKR